MASVSNEKNSVFKGGNGDVAERRRAAMTDGTRNAREDIGTLGHCLKPHASTHLSIVLSRSQVCLNVLCALRLKLLFGIYQHE